MKNYECIAVDDCLEITFSSCYKNIEKATADTLDLLKNSKVMVDRFDLKVVLHEVLGNAIRHGNGEDINKKVNFRVRVLNKTIEFEIMDEGKGIDPNGYIISKDNALTPHGMGLFIIKSLGFDMEFNTQKNILLLRKSINN